MTMSMIVSQNTVHQKATMERMNGGVDFTTLEGGRWNCYKVAVSPRPDRPQNDLSAKRFMRMSVLFYR